MGDDTEDHEMTDAGEGTPEPLERAAAAGPLAAVVDEARTEIAIEALRSEGVYDDERAVRPYADGKNALPITEPPGRTRIHAVVRQVDPDYRTSDLDGLLAERGWSERERERAPGSWAVVGSVVLVTIPPDCPDETDVAEALLSLHGEAETVLADEGVAGQFREPRTRHLAGERDTETVHVEHGTRYGLDPAKVMFSPGNQAERVRMGSIVDGAASARGTEESTSATGTNENASERNENASERNENASERNENASEQRRNAPEQNGSTPEHVFDMFAGIGYFTLPMARAGARVTATEVNSTAFRYLLENAVRNDVTDRVAAYNADCRELAETVAVDRVVMGYYGVSGTTGPDDAEPTDRAVGEPDETGRRRTAQRYLPAALTALEPGGILHYHEAVAEDDLWDGPVGRLERGVADAGRMCTIRERRRVKTHSAGVVHVVVDAEVE